MQIPRDRLPFALLGPGQLEGERPQLLGALFQASLAFRDVRERDDHAIDLLILAVVGQRPAQVPPILVAPHLALLDRGAHFTQRREQSGAQRIGHNIG